MNTTVTTILMGLLAVLGGGGGIYSAITLGAQRRKLVADASSVLTDSALQLVAAIKADAAAVRAELAESRTVSAAARHELLEARSTALQARSELLEARRDAQRCNELVRSLREQVDAILARLRAITALVNDPSMTIERLRAAMPEEYRE